MVLSIREGSKTRSSGAAADAAAGVAAGAGFWQNAGTAASTNANAREKRQGEALKQNMPQTLADLGLRKHGHAAGRYNYECRIKFPKEHNKWRNAPSASSSRTRSAKATPEPSSPRSQRRDSRL